MTRPKRARRWKLLATLAVVSMVAVMVEPNMALLGVAPPALASNIDVSKTAHPQTVLAGDTVEYKFDVTNNTGHNVSAFDFFVNGNGNKISPPFQLIQTINVSCSFESNHFRCPLGSSSHRSFSLIFRTPANQYCGQTVMNQVDVWTDSGQFANWAKAMVQVVCIPRADLLVTKFGPNEIVPPNDVTYGIDVRNNGPDRAKNVILRDRIPDGFTFLSSPGSNCNVNGNAVECFLGDIANGATREMTLVFKTQNLRCDGRSTVVNTATGTTDSKDDNTENNSHTIHTPLKCTPPPPPPKPQCSDGADNDGDFKIDCADPGCHTDGNPNNFSSCNPNDDDERDPPRKPQCSDGVDNDGDQKIDCSDPGCLDPHGRCVPEDDDERDPQTGGPLLRAEKIGPPQVHPGGVMSYTIKAHNEGNLPSHGTVVADHFDNGLLEYLPGQSTQGCLLEPIGAPPEIPKHVLCIIGEFPPQTWKTFTLAFKVKDHVQCPGEIRNKADVQAQGGFTSWVMITTPLTCEEKKPELHIKKKVKNLHGSTISYEIWGENVGGAPAHGVVLTDVPHKGLSFVSGNGCAPNGAVVDCHVGTLNPGQSVHFDLTFTIDLGLVCSDKGTVFNEADLKAENAPFAWDHTETPVDCDGGSSSSSSSVSSNHGPMLKGQKQGPIEVQPGGIVTYTVKAMNTGDAPSHGTVIADHFSNSLLEFLPDKSPGCSLQPQSGDPKHVLCVIGTLLPGQTASFQIAFKLKEHAPCGGILENKADVQAQGGLTDWVFANSTITCDPGEPELHVKKKVKEIHGSTIIYEIWGENSGSAPAFGVVLTDVPHTGLTFVSGDGCAPNGAVIDCHVGTLNPGQNVHFVLKFSIDLTNVCTNKGTVFNEADLKAENAPFAWDHTETPVDCDGGSSSSNTSSSNSSTISSSSHSSSSSSSSQTTPDLRLTKVGPSSVKKGSTATFNIKAENKGQPVVGAVIADHFPGSLTYDPSLSSPGCKLMPPDSPTHVLCEIGNLGPGNGVLSFDLSFTVNEHAVCGAAIRNPAVLQAAGGHFALSDYDLFVTCAGP